MERQYVAILSEFRDINSKVIQITKTMPKNLFSDVVISDVQNHYFHGAVEIWIKKIKKKKLCILISIHPGTIISFAVLM